MNPFTDLSRDAILSVNIDGFCTRLRAPDSLARLVKDAKPGHQGLGDFLLRAAFDTFLIDLIRAGRYRQCQTTLETFFGPVDHEAGRVPTPVGTDHERSQPPRKPPVAVPSGTPSAIRHAKVS